MFFKKKILGKDQLEIVQIGLLVGVGMGLIGEYGDAEDDAEVLFRKYTSERPAGVLL